MPAVQKSKLVYCEVKDVFNFESFNILQMKSCVPAVSYMCRCWKNKMLPMPWTWSGKNQIVFNIKFCDTSVL